MTRPLSILASLLLAFSVSAQTPGLAVEAAHADLARVRIDRRPFTRYLCMPHVSDKKELENWHAVLCFWVNSLSRESEIVAPRRVAANVWAVDLGDYRWSPSTWEKLADTEPYFTVRLVGVSEAIPAPKPRKKVTKVIEHKGGDVVNPETGNLIKNLAPGKYTYEVFEDVPAKPGEKAQKVKTALAPWLPAREHAALAQECQSAVPIVRLDWWLAEVATGNDRGTGYYDWLQLGKAEKDWQALIGADVKKARELRREIGALVSRSTVTLNNRALERFDAISGPYWRSRDFAKNTDIKNVLRLLDDDIQEDASEQYGSLPNRLWAFWLQDGKGVRADAAPDFIATDKKDPGVNGRVKVGISCVRCHQPGIQPINDWARKVYTPPFTLDDRVYEEAKRKRAKYLSDLNEQVEEDQLRYAKVLKKVNGLTPVKNAEAVAAAWFDYTERDRSLADVALELGVGKDALTDALKAEAKRTQIDPLLAGLLQSQEIRTEHLGEIVPLIYEIIQRGKP